MNDNDIVWSTKLAVDSAGKETLVIHCSDWRFIEITRRFLHEHLKVQSYDLIVVPGAIHFIVSRLFPKYVWVAKRWLKFFFKHHGTKRVIAFSHKDCGWYKKMELVESWSDKLREVQAKDAHHVPQTLSEINEGILFEHYFIDFTDTQVLIKIV